MREEIGRQRWVLSGAIFTGSLPRAKMLPYRERGFHRLFGERRRAGQVGVL